MVGSGACPSIPLHLSLHPKQDQDSPLGHYSHPGAAACVGCLCCFSPAKRNTEKQKAPEKIYTCLINVKCSLQTGVTSTSLYSIH